MILILESRRSLSGFRLQIRTHETEKGFDHDFNHHALGFSAWLIFVISKFTCLYGGSAIDDLDSQFQTGLLSSGKAKKGLVAGLRLPEGYTA